MPENSCQTGINLPPDTSLSYKIEILIADLFRLRNNN